MMSNFSPHFFIGSIRIGTIEGASAVNMGNNLLSDFQSQKKHNQGLGSITGDHNQIEGLRSLLHDPDFIDMLLEPSASEMPDWVKEILMEKMADVKEKN
jgi:ABC-type lipopolysaccharide export system ATPase subunit